MVDCPVSVDERSLSRAANEQLQAASSAVAVVMADLPLVTDAALERLCTREGMSCSRAGIGGGTNALVSRTTDFEVDYHDNSYLAHRSTAHEIGAALAEIDSYRLATDIDEPDDLAELLLHGEGHATQWLRDQGFRLASGTGRTTVRTHRRHTMSYPSSRLPCQRILLRGKPGTLPCMKRVISSSDAPERQSVRTVRRRPMATSCLPPVRYR